MSAGMSFKFTPVTAAEAGFSATVLSELDSYFETLVASGALPGHVMLLARGDQLVHGHVTGYADWDTKSPLHPDAIFRLFSMTKPLTAVAMLLLYDEGKWQLDDPVSLYLPEFKNIARLPGSRATREPTLREIFTHTAGFGFGRTREQMLDRMQRIAWHKAGSLTELIGRYASMPLDYEPGTAWEYSGATDLQAAIVERLTGERFDLFLERRLFEPLGMHDTAFGLSHAQTCRLVPGHVFEQATCRLRPANDADQMESIYPMGGTSFKSSALDFARFARMLLNRGSLGDVQVLRPATVALMLSNQLPASVLENRYSDAHYVIGQGNGHGLNGLVCLDPRRAGRPVGTGTYEWGGAFGTWFWVDPENDLLCVGMTHRRRVSTDMRPLEVVAQEMVYRALRNR
jgi:CubicO group peptidase (beta-lactamase class C family)